jgi:aspartokinase
VPGAALLPRLSYQEATLFATLGAKVLHPKTMEPASEAGIEVFVRDSFDPPLLGRASRTVVRGGIALRRSAAGPCYRDPCTQGREKRVASVVCIGNPRTETWRAARAV